MREEAIHMHEHHKRQIETNTMLDVKHHMSIKISETSMATKPEEARYE